MAESLTYQARSVYRALLRELPRRPLSERSPLHTGIRALFYSDAVQEGEHKLTRVQEADQFVKYAKAQRSYATLLERYNPGMGMDQDERVRLSARRVGLNLPVEHKKEE